jgi:hypothetical protein
MYNYTMSSLIFKLWNNLANIWHMLLLTSITMLSSNNINLLIFLTKIYLDTAANLSAHSPGASVALLNIPKSLRLEYAHTLTKTLTDFNNNPTNLFIASNLLLMPKLILNIPQRSARYVGYSHKKHICNQVKFKKS